MRFFKYILFFYFFIFFNTIFFAQVVESPVIDFVSVNQSSSLPVINWHVNNSSQINGYAVKRFIRTFPSVPDNTWHTVKRIENPNIFSYEDNSISYGSANPDIQSEIYEVVAYKISGTDTIFSLPSEKHKTICVSGDYDYCLNKITIIWNNYVGWGNDFLKYQVFCKENNGSYIKIGEKLFNDTTFIHNNLNYNSEYTYYIKALRNDGIESVSNLKIIKTNAIIFPLFLNIDSVLVKNNIEFDLYFSPDINSDIDKYILFKSDKYDTDYLKSDSLLFPENNNHIYLFSDRNFNPNIISYYFVAAEDYCGNIVFKSDTVSNIVLSATAFSDTRINILKWDDIYLNYNYHIFRSQDGTQYEEIINVPIHSFDDNIQSIYENQFLSETLPGKFCYYVQINENNFLNKSNISCAEQAETIIFPNAFNPKSNIDENRIFKPKAAFISNYKLTIYGSFGDVVFESKNPDYGWNGLLKNGKLAPISSYLYIAKYKNSKGKFVNLKNYVTLVY